MRNARALTLIVGLSTACAARPELEPAAGAQPAPPGPGAGAMATSNGVTVIARADAWSGFPERLDEVTPVLVTIENGSRVPIRLRYNRFALVAPNGETYAAIPPFDIEGEETEPIDRYVDGFYVAPHLRGYYPGIPAYTGYYPSAYDYYDLYYPRFLEIELPTGDMVQKALPEGVLMPGGRISGYLYFENVDADVPTVDFTMQLVESVDGDGAPFGAVRIPFRVQ